MTTPTPTTAAPTPTIGAGSTTEIRWPAERFYWALVEVPGTTNARRIETESLRSLIADEIPVPVDHVHPVATPVASGKILVCAVLREDLRAVTADQPLVVKVLPASLPPGISDDDAADQINLLTGEFEPVPLRAERRTRWFIAALAAAAVFALAAIGLDRRATAWHEEAVNANAATSSLLDQVLPRNDSDEMTNAASNENRVFALRQELGSLRGLRAPSMTPDAAVTLAGVLGRLPRLDETRTEFIGITPTSASVTMTTSGDPAPLVREIAPPPGWRLGEPRLTTANGSTRIALELTRTNEAGGTPP